MTDGRLRGQVCLVTGATGGIGRVTAEALAARGAAVVLAGRDEARMRATAEAVRSATGNDRVDGLVADLSAQAGVRRLADEFMSRHDRLDVLVNNAGAVFMRRAESADGIEMTLALNHLAPFLLTGRLLALIKASAPARVINVASSAHWMARIAFDDLEARRRYNGWLAYAQSKLANVLFTYELARRVAGTGVTANALHPGLVATSFGLNNRHFPWPIMMRLSRPLSLTPEEGARTSIHLATSPDVADVSGRYFAGSKPVRSSPASYDEGVAARLWHVSAELTKPRVGEGDGGRGGDGTGRSRARPVG
jgi:NAD(P)-dependent dehydrogenase (short-subunit alcohol dehydrogenase family)